MGSFFIVWPLRSTPWAWSTSRHQTWRWIAPPTCFELSLDWTISEFVNHSESLCLKLRRIRASSWTRFAIPFAALVFLAQHLRCCGVFRTATQVGLTAPSALVFIWKKGLKASWKGGSSMVWCRDFNCLLGISHFACLGNSWCEACSDLVQLCPTRSFWMPDYNYHYEIPEADLEVGFALFCIQPWCIPAPGNSWSGRSSRWTPMVKWTRIWLQVMRLLLSMWSWRLFERYSHFVHYGLVLDGSSFLHGCCLFRFV